MLNIASQLAAQTKLQQLFAKKYQSKVNHKNFNHESKNNSQAKIEDKEQKNQNKSMNYDALIYDENIYATLI